MLVSPPLQSSAHSPRSASFPRPHSLSRKSKTSSGSTSFGGPAGASSVATQDPFTRWRPSYHFIAPKNWMNDPCGPLFDPKTGLYHLLYEYNPKGATWGNMSWMHATSTDLVTWRHVSNEPVIKSSTAYDGEGIFSGGMILHGPNGEKDQMTAVYTAVSNLPIHWTRDYHWGSEKLALVVSSDGGKTWTHSEQSLILDSPPKDLEGKIISWRDPFISAWPEMDKLLGETGTDNLYGLISGGLRDQTPTAFLYKLSPQKLHEWSYIGTIADVGLNTELAKGYSGDMGRNWEVCNFFQIDGHNYLLMNVEGCGANLKDRHAMWARCDLSLTATVDEKKHQPRMLPKASCLIDHGCLYAATTFHNVKDGRRILWGWVPEDDLGEDRYEEQGWSGCMALPRELFHATYDRVVGTFNNQTDPASMANFHIEEGPVAGTKKLTMLASRPVVESQLLRESAVEVDLPSQELGSPSEGKSTVAAKGIHSRNVEIECEMEILDETTTTEIGFILCHNSNMSRYVEVVYEPRQERLVVRRSNSSSERSVNLDSVSAPFTLLRQQQADASTKLEMLRWHVLLDNSVLEVFINDRCALTTRIYADDDSCKDVSFLVHGAGKVKIHGGKAWVGLKTAMLDAHTGSTATGETSDIVPPSSSSSASSSSRL
ncbi:Arabinanase/levansucrase/invertase [Acaromyces ingoldii]|uniref:Arabinanase/levansucrase/invertase n=1 Tax=Acaromyces ingoldii TaxID=215250 RepID=A0A316YXB3_9BASI|nr:Arabinanase/levansucrase/invertase [Acaromyces ingoldii]PWN93752.1 Arabinanase/levansucrase/invertase [Acaromyces ingoldii]